MDPDEHLEDDLARIMLFCLKRPDVVDEAKEFLFRSMDLGNTSKTAAIIWHSVCDARRLRSRCKEIVDRLRDGGASSMLALQSIDLRFNATPAAQDESFSHTNVCVISDKHSSVGEQLIEESGKSQAFYRLRKRSFLTTLLELEARSAPPPYNQGFEKALENIVYELHISDDARDVRAFFADWRQYIAAQAEGGGTPANAELTLIFSMKKRNREEGAGFSCDEGKVVSLKMARMKIRSAGGQGKTKDDCSLVIWHTLADRQPDECAACGAKAAPEIWFLKLTGYLCFACEILNKPQDESRMQRVGISSSDKECVNCSTMSATHWHNGVRAYYCNACWVGGGWEEMKEARARACSAPVKVDYSMSFQGWTRMSAVGQTAAVDPSSDGQCDDCKTKFTYTSLWRRMWWRHDSTGRYLCNVCRFYYVNSADGASRPPGAASSTPLPSLGPAPSGLGRYNMPSLYTALTQDMMYPYSRASTSFGSRECVNCGSMFAPLARHDSLFHCNICTLRIIRHPGHAALASAGQRVFTRCSHCAMPATTTDGNGDAVCSTRRGHYGQPVVGGPLPGAERSSNLPDLVRSVALGAVDPDSDDDEDGQDG